MKTDEDEHYTGLDADISVILTQDWGQVKRPQIIYAGVGAPACFDKREGV